jgi:hypothetical protein
MKVSGVQAVGLKTLIFQHQEFIDIGKSGKAIYKVHVGGRKE